MKRSRLSASLRPLYLKCGLNGQSPGSAYIELGATKVVATVYGPRENTRAEGETVSSGVLECYVKLAPFSSRIRGNFPGETLERELQLGAALHASLLPSVLLERFPKSVVEVHLLVLEAGGGELAVGITAASAALVDAGVDLAGVVTAAQVGFESGGEVIVDPTSAEELDCTGLTTVAYMPSLERITFSSHSGTVAAPDLLKALALALGACAGMSASLRPVLLDSVNTRLASPLERAGDLVEEGRQTASENVKHTEAISV